MGKLQVVKKNDFLNGFEEAVYKNNDKSCKLPYVDWRELKNNTAPYLCIVSSPIDSDIFIYFVKEDRTYDFFQSYPKDKIEFFFDFLNSNKAQYEVFRTIDGIDHLLTNLTEILKTAEFCNLTLTDTIEFTTPPIGYVNKDANLKSSFDTICRQTASLDIATGIATISGNYTTGYCNPYTVTIETSNNIKENDTMNTKNIFNFDFGPAPSTQFRLSPCGLAVATKDNGWVSYDAKTGDLVDVNIINFDLTNLIYKMPVALSAIRIGDILMHSGKPVFVKTINADNTITAIDYATATVSNILPVKSPFGFNFFTKICALFDFSTMSASNDQPFGNMLPFLLMQNGDFDPMMAFFLMNGNNNMNFTNNPMMMYFLMKDNKDMLPFLFLQNSSPVAPNPEPQTI